MTTSLPAKLQILTLGISKIFGTGIKNIFMLNKGDKLALPI